VVKVIVLTVVAISAEVVGVIILFAVEMVEEVGVNILLAVEVLSVEVLSVE